MQTSCSSRGGVSKEGQSDSGKERNSGPENHFDLLDKSILFESFVAKSAELKFEGIQRHSSLSVTARIF